MERYSVIHLHGHIHKTKIEKKQGLFSDHFLPFFTPGSPLNHIYSILEIVFLIHPKKFHVRAFFFISNQIFPH